MEGRGYALLGVLSVLPESCICLLGIAFGWLQNGSGLLAIRGAVVLKVQGGTLVRGVCPY